MTKPTNTQQARNGKPLATPEGLTKMGRRSFVAAVAGVATAVTALARDYGPKAKPVRYPDPDIVVLDNERAWPSVLSTLFHKYTHVSGGCRWAQHAVPLQFCWVPVGARHAVPEVPDGPPAF